MRRVAKISPLTRPVSMLLQRSMAQAPFPPPANEPARRPPSRRWPSAALPSRTQRIMERISTSGEVGGAGGAYSYSALKRLDQLWSGICSTQSGAKQIDQIIFRISGSFNDYDPDKKANTVFDVLVCGGTLGIFVATALLSKGLRVGIVEKNQIKGREQEWNISRKELVELVQVGILLEEDIEHIILTKFNPNRCGFEQNGDIWVQDILNLGVSPFRLLEVMKKRFVSLGGVLFEGKCLSTVNVHDDLAVLRLSDGEILVSRLLVDAMGNFSPLVKQIRSGHKPDGVCLVVGSCSRGFKENSSSDIIYSSSSVRKIGDTELQYFWEAFPAGSGLTDRTTYMFTYVDAQPGCPKLEELLEDYWDLLPAYQIVVLSQYIGVKYYNNINNLWNHVEERDLYSPLPTHFDRVIQVGDASGIQSPVSFGGFGSMTRHLNRLSNGIYEAVTGDFLDAYSLSLLNPYLPNLNASWLFQRAMSAKPDADVPSTFINELLYANFLAMQRLGDSVLKPFLQDIVQFWPLLKTLSLVMLTQPQLLPSIFKQVGFDVIFDWSVHFAMLGYYTFLSSYVDPIIRPWIKLLPPKKKYEWNMHLEAWKYGAGLDYTLPRKSRE